MRHFAPWELAIMEDPTVGTVMSGTGGLRKMRFAPPGCGRGKSGSLRVGYAYVVVLDQILLVAVFGKNEKANLTPAERNEIRGMLDEYKNGVTDRGEHEKQEEA